MPFAVGSLVLGVHRQENGFHDAGGNPGTQRHGSRSPPDDSTSMSYDWNRKRTLSKGDTMKPIVRCLECSSCGVVYGFGFIGQDSRVCTLSGLPVDGGDGCTLGDAGEPVQAVEPLDVDISGRVGYVPHYSD